MTMINIYRKFVHLRPNRLQRPYFLVNTLAIIRHLFALKLIILPILLLYCQWRLKLVMVSVCVTVCVCLSVCVCLCVRVCVCLCFICMRIPQYYYYEIWQLFCGHHHKWYHFRNVNYDNLCHIFIASGLFLSRELLDFGMIKSGGEYSLMFMYHSLKGGIH